MKKKLLFAALVLFVTNLSAGDVNGDGTVDVADIAAIIDVMAGTITNDELRITADVNSDGAVDVADIAAVISIMAGEQPQTGQEVNITEAQGWHETVYAKWDLEIGRAHV